MKTIIIIILSLFLVTASAQKVVKDTLFSDYEKDLRILYNPENNSEPCFYKSAIIIFGTFLINEAIIRHDKSNGYKNTTRKTGIVYIAGITTATIVFSFDLKKHKKKNPKDK